MTVSTTPVRERPILFSGEMVRAILNGRKSQTRRVVTVPGPTKTRFGATLVNAAVTTWQREATDLTAHGMPADDCHYLLGPEREGEYLICNLVGDIGIHRQHCPYGNVGDRLWVRETWAELDSPCMELADEDPNVRIFAPDPEDESQDRYTVYRADAPDQPPAAGLPWHPSIHMPRWASRLTLEITGVGVERVQDISDDDCIAEGILGDSYLARQNYLNLWDELNATRGYGWALNPWVWVIAFKPVPALAIRRDGEKA